MRVILAEGKIIRKVPSPSKNKYTLSPFSYTSSFDIRTQGILKTNVKNHTRGWAWWLMPVIPTLWETEVADHLRSGVQDQPDQYGETLSLLKIQKLAGHGGTHL